MNVIEALRMRRNLRRPVESHMGSNGDGWLDWRYVLVLLTEGASHGLPEADVMADDWEVQSWARERLQKRISRMMEDTGIHPTVLDISEADFEEFRSEAAIPTWGFGKDVLVFYAASGTTRIAIARK